MRHGKKFNHLGRKKAHRAAMLSNMACSLIEHKRINTTVAKAKALKMYVEPLITKSKTDSTHSRRTVFSYLKDKYAVTELFREVAPKIANRPGGYTRIIKTGFRQGDAAEMCLIELVDFNEIYGSSSDGAKKKRSRRGGAKKKTGVAGAVATATEGAKAVADKAADVAGDVAEAASDAVDTVKEKASDAVDAVKDVASNVADKAGEVAEAAKDKVEDIVDDITGDSKDDAKDGKEDADKA